MAFPRVGRRAGLECVDEDFSEAAIGEPPYRGMEA
jgi:hypothetical protein